MSKKIVMGLDLSTTSTGICLMGPKNYKTWNVGTSAKEKLPLMKRIFKVRDKISLLASKFEPDLIIIEDYAYGKFSNSSSVSMNIELAAIVKLYFYDRIPYILIPPTVNKKWIFKKGTAKKEHMLKEVFKRFKVDVDTSDEADAYGLAEIGYHLISNIPRRPLLKHEIDIIASLRKSEEKILRKSQLIVG